MDDDDDYFSEDLSTSPSERATTFQIIPKDMESLFAFGIKEYKGQVDCIITDPPWNIGFNGAISKGTMKSLCQYSYDYLKDTGSVVIMCSSQQISYYIKYLKETGFQSVHEVVVISPKKTKLNTFITQRTFYYVYGLKTTSSIVNYSSSDKGLILEGSTYLPYENILDGYKHPNPIEHNGIKIRSYEKSVPFLQVLIKRFMKEDYCGLIIDPFAGSCSTLRAAILENKNCICGDIDKAALEAVRSNPLFQSVEYKPLQVEMISEDDLQQQNIDDKDTILDIKERYLGNRRMHMVYFIPLTNRKFNYLKSIGICAPI